MTRRCFHTMLVVMKACLLVALIGFFAGSAWAAQRVRIPYAINGGGWWSGIAITNLSSMDITPIVYVYDSNGNGDCVTLDTLATQQMYVVSMDQLLDMLPTVVNDQRLSLSVVSNSAAPFGVTLFVGQNNGGFGFQEFESEDAGSFLFVCIPTLSP